MTQLNKLAVAEAAYALAFQAENASLFDLRPEMQVQYKKEAEVVIRAYLEAIEE